MLDETKIRKMTNLARIEKKEQKRGFRIVSWFRSDYIGLELVKNFILYTICYCIILVMLAFCHIDWLLESFDHINLIRLGAVLLIGYLIFIAVFLALTYMHAFLVYKKAKSSMEQYEDLLDDLAEDYRHASKQEKKRRERA